MPRVAKNRRKARQRRQDYAELAARFQAFMRDNGCDGYVVASASGVSVSSHPPPGAPDPVSEIRELMEASEPCA